MVLFHSVFFFGNENTPDPFFNGEGPVRSGCIECGACLAGCVNGAKNTLDKNYLYFAEKGGARVQPEANVLDIRPIYGESVDGARYEITFEKTTAWFVKPQRRVRARSVVFSAGVMASTASALCSAGVDGMGTALSPAGGKELGAVQPTSDNDRTRTAAKRKRDDKEYLLGTELPV